MWRARARHAERDGYGAPPAGGACRAVRPRAEPGDEGRARRKPALAGGADSFHPTPGRGMVVERISGFVERIFGLVERISGVVERIRGTKRAAEALGRLRLV